MTKKATNLDPSVLEFLSNAQRLGSKAIQGVGCTEISEPLPQYDPAGCEKTYEGKNNKYGYESTTHIWLKENGHKWNWVNPDWAAKGRSQAEPWHFEWVPRDTVLEGEKAAKAWYSY